ncbi:MAG: histidinol-phosphate transaminase [Armatimonadetes bacterium]|nr:histidinol-phosphate transaminase [Armatimonadota bacterium]
MSTLRANVLRMQPYVPGKPIEEVQRELGLSSVVKLASNENPLGPSPKAVAAVQEAAKRMHVYPDASGHAVKQKLAEKAGLDKCQVLLGNGSDELIHLLGLIHLEKGDEMVVADPTFVRYEAAAHLAEATLVKVPLDHSLTHDLVAMADAVTPRTKLVFVANPHNPTGTVVSKEAFDAFLDRIPETATVVLDEAYFEYGPQSPDGVEYVKAGRNVVVLRTFSKAYGLAGIRVGYGFADASVVDAVDRAREPFDVNALAQAAAVTALDDTEHLDRSRQVNTSGLARITRIMACHGFTAVPSFANFICVDIGRPAQPVFEALLRQGVVVRAGGPLGLPNYLRISVGTDAEIDRLEEALASAVSVTV